MSSLTGEPRPGAAEPGSDGRLDSWKEIAAYLRRSVRSAKRWEKEEGLPVHRHLHGKRDSVYAYRTELDRWWENRGASLGDQNGAEDDAWASDKPLPADAPATVAISAPVAALPRAPKSLRTAVLVAVGLFVPFLIAAVWVSRHSSGLAPQWNPLPFQSRDWVLVAAFENRTGQALLDGTLEYALERELSNSRHVNVVPRDRIGDVLRLMRKPLETRVDAALGREICLRDGGIRALITGRIEKLGSKYFLSVQLADPNQSGSVKSAAAQATIEELLPAARRVSDEIRAMLGENQPSIREDRDKLLKVTTPSLRALQLYSRADALIAQAKNAAAEELLKQAVAEDPEFASAHIHLAYAIHNQQRPREDYLPAAETAFRLSATTTERESYFIRGSYYHFLGQGEKAIAAYQALLTLYPDHFWGTGNLANALRNQGRSQDATDLDARRADLRPRDFLANFSAAWSIAPMDRVRSRVYVRRALELVSPADMQEFPSSVARLELMPAAEYWLDGNLEKVLRIADGLAIKIDSLSGSARQGFAEQVFPVYLELGRLDAAERSVRKIADPILQHDLLARLAFLKDDPREVTRQLEASQEGAPLAPPRVGLLARVGLLPQATELLARFEKCCADTAWIQVLRGELALARGDVNNGVSELEDGTRRLGEGSPHFFLGSESLATALERKGDFAGAVGVLERASARRPAAAFQYGGSYWLRSRLLLARLYRETGRAQDARPIEDDLRKYLTFADPDHPIRRELDRLKGS